MTRKFNPKIADIARQKIGEFLKERRLSLPRQVIDRKDSGEGWTQAELAETAGLRRATVTDIENGKPCDLNSIIALIGCMRGELFIEWKDIDSVAGMEPTGKN